jgi:hypothetical protein
MGRERDEQKLPDLLSAGFTADSSPQQPGRHVTGEADEPAPARHVLPKDLRAAVSHLSNGELDRLHTATLDEMRRRGRLPTSAGAADTGQSSVRRVPLKYEKTQRYQAGIPEASLTRGQINAVRSAFKAGITPARIAKQFGISQSNVRKALAINEPKR